MYEDRKIENNKKNYFSFKCTVQICLSVCTCWDLAEKRDDPKEYE